MSIEINTEKGVCHAKIDGEMTIFTGTEYRLNLLECKTEKGMVLDLTGVSEIDVCGLQLLLSLKKYLDVTEQGLQLLNPSEVVQQALEMSRLTETFDNNIEVAHR